MLYFTILTLLPEMFPGPLGHSLIGRALEQGQWSLNVIDIRHYGLGKHRQVDDTPYGGGAGMVMRADVLEKAIDEALRITPNAQLIYFTPRGERMTQAKILDLATPFAARDYVLLCGRFEAVDERILSYYQPLELSLGDFVMTGGELAAMALIDAAVRLIPGVVGDPESLQEESFGLSQDYACLVEHPHYSKPPIWKGQAVPDVLLSGDHAKIKAWRLSQAEAETKARRPDLWTEYQARKGL